MLGYTLMQHLVGARWEEFNAEEHSHVATLAYNMLKQGGSVRGAQGACVSGSLSACHCICQESGMST